MERIEVDPVRGCWLWRGGLNKKGYAQRSVGGKTVHAHRAVWIELHGPLGPHEFVCHRCDVRHCCNPDHLFVGSAADNNADMTAKGRRARVLTADQVREIRADPRLHRQIANDYGVTQSNVSRIKSRVTWAHLNQEA